MGREVIGGLFKFYDSNGIPLDVIFDILENNNCIPGWLDFVQEALKSGWKQQTIMTRLRESIADVYGTAYWLVVEERLNKFFKEMEEKEPESSKK